MSALLIFFYWIVIPIGGFKLASWLFRRTKSLVIKGLVVLGTLILFIWFLWIAVGRNMWLDHQVRELCTKDGGVKVYETVILPAERFDKYGNVHIPSKNFAKPTDEYYYESKNQYFQKGNADQTGNPDIFQYNFRIVRHLDGKIMGESISYIRRGGGLPGPWHPSSFSCPEHSDPARLIFKSQEKNQ